MAPLLKLYKYGPHSLKTTLEMFAVLPIGAILEQLISRLWISVGRYLDGFLK